MPEAVSAKHATSSSSPYEPSALSPSGDRPTLVRYHVLLLLCVLALITYVDRICISQAAPHIQKELGISESAMSFVFAAFTLSYALFEVATGYLGDRYGSRGVMMRIVIWWSIFTALTGTATGLYSLLLIRFLFGAGEAGAFPNTARILSNWFPAHRRGFAQGAFNSAALCGGAVAPVSAAYLIEWAGWRWAFAIFAIPGVLWALYFYYWYRDDPAEHPSVNESERTLILHGRVAKDKDAEHPPIPWRLVATSPNIWLLGFVLSCTAFNSYLYFSWYPTYLQKARDVSNVTSGWLSSLVLTGGAVGSLLGGWLADWLLLKTRSRRWSRSGLGFAALATSSLLLLTGVHTHSAIGSAIWTTASVLLTFTTLASWWGAVTDISGRHLGALFGLMNSLGGLGAITSQLFVGPFADWMAAQGYTGRAQWDPAFYVYSSVLMLGALGWLCIDVRRSVDPGASEPEAIT